jgi:thiamine-monophosphate kinase
MASAPLSEFELIERIRSQVTHNPGIVLGIGDDCAILSPTPQCSLVTTDMLLDGRHFILAECGPEAVGEKAMGVNLSDIAAMAGKPIAAFVSIGLPRQSADTTALGILKGLRKVAERFNVELAGGDTNVWDGPLAINVTLIGETVPPGPVHRSGAQAGDGIFVTGPLGGSILGRHLHPKPRIAESLQLRACMNLHSMIDLSDGLASDLRHILAASGNLGAILFDDAIPIHDDAWILASRDGRSALEHALCDGEDFELCFTAPRKEIENLVLPDSSNWHPVLVGEIQAEPGLRSKQANGQIEPLTLQGFDHMIASKQFDDAL